MDLFDLLAMIGGLCLFLFGMNIMGEGLERRAGNGLKALLGKLTNSKIKGFLTGLGVTAVIQSSSATTVMVVGFVNSKVMTLKQSIGVIMGANIGTTVTAWILSLGGISSDNVIVQLLKPSSFTPVLALIGIIFTMFAKSSNKKDVGTILLGFATLMFGMEAMSDAVRELSEVVWFRELFVLFTNPILGVLIGAFVTAVIQSSSASVGILQALSATGSVSYAAAIPIIMGQNIGTCVTAMLSSFGTNKNAKRAAVIHLSFNVVGTVIWLSVFAMISAIFQPAILGESASFLGIAVCHSVFNILCTVLLLPASALLEKIAYWVVPEGKGDAAKAEKLVELDERLLLTPAIALAQSRNLACKMASEAMEGFRLSIRAIDDYTPELAERIREMEDDTDRYEDVLGTYLTKLSPHQLSDADSATVSLLLKAIGDFERISDHGVNVIESVEELREKGIELSDGAKEELRVLCRAVEETLEITEHAFLTGDTLAARDVEPLEEVVDELKTALRDSHIVRLKGGECTVEAGFIWADLLTNFERVSDHCSNVAVGVMDAAARTMDVHASLRLMKREDPCFAEKLKEYSEKYSLSVR